LNSHDKNNTDPFEDLPPYVSFLPLVQDGKIKSLVLNKKFVRFHKQEFIPIEEIIEDIIVNGRLDGVDRVGIIITYSGIGDIYYAISALNYLAKELSKKLVFIYSRNNTSEIFSYFSHNSLKFEILPISAFAHRKIISNVEYVTQKYDNYIKYCSHKFNDKMHAILHYNRQPLVPLLYPKFPDFDADFYINQYDVIPGKTFFIIPISQYIKNPPVYFWNFCAEIFKFMGYNVLFNVPDDVAYRYSGRNCFAPFRDAVGLANLCGNVFATRTGFLDLISTTKANMIILDNNRYMPIDKIYHIDNPDKRIKSIYINSLKAMDYEDFNPIRFVKEYTDEIVSGFKNQLKVREDLNKISPKVEIKIPDIEAYQYAASQNEAKRTAFSFLRFPTLSICPCKYSFTLEKDILYLQLYELDLKEYRLDIILKCHNTIVLTLKDYNILSVIFKPKFKGEYKFEISIYDKSDLHLEFFITDTIYFKSKGDNI